MSRPDDLFLYDDDGRLIGIPGHHHSRKDLLEILRTDVSYEYEWRDSGVIRFTDTDEERISHTIARELLEEWFPGWMRKADPAVPQESSGMFGSETYWPAESDHPDALPFMRRSV